MTAPATARRGSNERCPWRIEDDGVAVVHLPQEMQGSVCAALRSSIGELLRIEPKGLVLSLEQTRMVDSSGLSVLVSVHRTAREQDLPLVLARPRPQIQKLLELTRLQQLLPIVETLESALVEVRSELSSS